MNAMCTNTAFGWATPDSATPPREEDIWPGNIGCFWRTARTFDVDYATHMLLYAGEGEIEETAADRERHTSAMGGDSLDRCAQAVVP